MYMSVENLNLFQQRQQDAALPSISTGIDIAAGAATLAVYFDYAGGDKDEDKHGRVKEDERPLCSGSLI